MTTLLVLGAALAGFALFIAALFVFVLREVEEQRVDLVNDARPCSRGLRVR